MGLHEFWDRMLKRGERAPTGGSSEELAGYNKRREYKMEKLLGSGTYGEVRLATHIRTNQQFAIKVVKKSFLEAHKKTNMVKRETFVLGLLQHPNIIRMTDSFETKDKYYIVFELATGGELFDRIVERGKFTERDAAVVMATIINAVVYLHEQPNEIIHRDLKPENLIFLNKSIDSPLVIVDFGIAKVMSNPTDMLTTVCGSPGYTAPEVLRRVPYGKPVDIYSCGVIAYTLLCGYGPFAEAKDITQMCDRIVLGQYRYDSPWWDPVSDLAKDFVTRLMELDPRKRLTARQCLHHDWLTKNCPPGYIAHLRKINEQVLRQEFKVLGLEMPSTIRTMPRRPSSAIPNHPLASLAKLAPIDVVPAIPPPQSQAALDQMQLQIMQAQQLQAQLQAEQQQMKIQQQLQAQQFLAEQQAKAQQAAALYAAQQQQQQQQQQPGQQVLVQPVFAADQPMTVDVTRQDSDIPLPTAGSEGDDDYDPYEFLVDLEDDNLADPVSRAQTETFKRGILHIAEEADKSAASSLPNLLDEKRGSGSGAMLPKIDLITTPAQMDSLSRKRWDMQTIKNATFEFPSGSALKAAAEQTMEISEDDEEMEPASAV